MLYRVTDSLTRKASAEKKTSHRDTEWDRVFVHNFFSVQGGKYALKNNLENIQWPHKPLAPLQKKGNKITDIPLY